MKSVLFSAVIALALMNPATSQAASVDDAKNAYAQREYDNAGVLKAQEAAKIYAELVTQASDQNAKVALLVGQSDALYFIADASSENSVKVAKFNEGYQIADQAAKLMGIQDVKATSEADIQKLKSSLSSEGLQLLGKALYARGTNLGKWGQANGVTTSLGRWPELRANMELMGKLGLDETREYGSHRTLGKAYATLPGLLGGSTAKALSYLKTAVSKTLAAGEKYSVNGTNNVYLAEVLNENGNTEEAKALLQAFLKADPATLNPELVPETRRAQAEAQELLKDM